MEGIEFPIFHKCLGYLDSYSVPDYFTKGASFSLQTTDRYCLRDSRRFNEGALSRREELQALPESTSRKTQKLTELLWKGDHHGYNISRDWEVLGVVGGAFGVATGEGRGVLFELESTSKRRYCRFDVPDKFELFDALWEKGQPLRLVFKKIQILTALYVHAVFVHRGNVAHWDWDVVREEPPKKQPAQKEDPPQPVEKGPKALSPTRSSSPLPEPKMARKSLIMPWWAVAGLLTLAVVTVVRCGYIKSPIRWSVWRAPDLIVPPPVVPDPALIFIPPPPLGFPRG